MQTFWETIKNWLVTNRIMESESDLNSQTVLLGLGTSTIVNRIILVAKMIIAKIEYLNLREATSGLFHKAFYTKFVVCSL